MAIIHFTAGDALQTKVIEPKIYGCEVSSFDGPKKSSSGKSVNYFVDIEVTDEGPYKGKARTIVFNSGVNSPSLLGEMQMYPVSYLLQLQAAIEGKDDVDAVSQDMDTDQLLHAPFDCAWGTAIVEGRLINVINSFHPAGCGKTVVGF